MGVGGITLSALPLPSPFLAHNGEGLVLKAVTYSSVALPFQGTNFFNYLVLYLTVSLRRTFCFLLSL